MVQSTFLLLTQPQPCLPHSPPCLNHSWDPSVPGTWQPLPTPGCFCFFCRTCSLARPVPSLPSHLSLHIISYGSFPWPPIPLIRSPNPQNYFGKLLTILINNSLCDSLFNVHLLWQTIYFKRTGANSVLTLLSISSLSYSARHLWGLSKHWLNEGMDDQGSMGAYSEWQELLNEMNFMNIRFQTQKEEFGVMDPLEITHHSFIQSFSEYFLSIYSMSFTGDGYNSE